MKGMPEFSPAPSQPQQHHQADEDEDSSGRTGRRPSQPLLPVPQLHDAAAYFTQTASYFTQCFSGSSDNPEEGHELIELSTDASLRVSAENSESRIDFITNTDSLKHGQGETSSSGGPTNELTEPMWPTAFFQNGTSLFQDLVNRARKTMRGSADDIGWLQRDQSMPPTEDGTNRFLEILESIRRNEHKLSNSVVYLLVPGLFSNHGPLYFVKTKTYFSKMGLACHIAKIHSEASVETNAREVKNYIEEIYWGAQKKVMILGHSKGGVDSAAALSLYWSELKDKVAGLVLAQSPYGGSPVASDLLREGQLGDYVRLRKIMEILICKVLKGDLQALEDLTYEKRMDFIRKHPLPRELPVVSFHTEAGITPTTLTSLSHVAHLELPAIAPLLTDSQPTRLPVVIPLAATMAACSQLIQIRYGEKSDGLVTRRDAEVPGSVVIRPNRKLDHAWMVYSSPNDEPSGEADTSQVCEALLTLLVEVGQKRRHEIAMKDD